MCTHKYYLLLSRFWIVPSTNTRNSEMAKKQTHDEEEPLWKGCIPIKWSSLLKSVWVQNSLWLYTTRTVPSSSCVFYFSASSLRHPPDHRPTDVVLYYFCVEHQYASPHTLITIGKRMTLLQHWQYDIWYRFVLQYSVECVSCVFVASLLHISKQIRIIPLSRCRPRRCFHASIHNRVQ